MKATDRFFVEGVTCTRDASERMPVANLSVGGLFAATSTPPLKGQLVALDLSLAGRAPLRLMGKVTWVNDPARPKAAHLPQGFGFKITEIAFPDKLAILDFLKRLGPNAARTRET